MKGIGRARNTYFKHTKSHFHRLHVHRTKADNRTFEAVGKGSVRIKIPNDGDFTTITLRDVLYAPTIGFTLISLSQADKASYPTLIRAGDLRILDRGNDDDVIGKIPARNGLWSVRRTIKALENGESLAAGFLTVLSAIVTVVTTSLSAVVAGLSVVTVSLSAVPAVLAVIATTTDGEVNSTIDRSALGDWRDDRLMEDNLYVPAGRPLVTSAALRPLKKAKTRGLVGCVESRDWIASTTTWLCPMICPPLFSC